MGVYAKLLIIQKAVIGLKKDSSSKNYTYTSGEKVIDHIKPLMNLHGLLLKQEILSIDNERIDYTLLTGREKSEILSTVMMRFTWVDVDSGETDVNLWGGNGQNEWEKGVNSAATSGERYFFLKYFHICTDKDDIDNPERKPADGEAEAAKPKATPAAVPASTSPPAKAKPYDKVLTSTHLHWNALIVALKLEKKTINEMKLLYTISEQVENELKEAVLNA